MSKQLLLAAALAFASAGSMVAQTSDTTEGEETTAYTIKIAPSTGTFTMGGVTYGHLWTSTASPTVTLANSDGSTTNNMAGDTSRDGIELREGSGTSFGYTVSAQSGYAITSMTFKAVSYNSAQTVTVALSIGETISLNSTEQEFSYTGLNERSITMSFSSSDSNDGAYVYDWTVTLEPVEVDSDPHISISTDEEQHWYYVVSSSTKSYCEGKVWYYGDDGAVLFGDKAFLPNYLWSFWKQTDSSDAAASESEDSEPDYTNMAIKSYTGQWLKTNSNQFTLSDDPTYGYSVAFYEDGGFTIEDANPSSNGKYIHAQESGTILVHWSADTGNASMWSFEEVDLTESDAALQSTTVEQGKVTTGRGNTNVPIIRSTMVVSGLDGEISLTGVSGKVKATDLSDVTGIRAYFATNAQELYVDPDNLMPWREPNGELWVEGTMDEEGNYTIEIPTAEESTDGETSDGSEGSGEGDETGNVPAAKTLAPGTYYLWICLDIAEEATEGNTVDATITSYTVDGQTVTEKNGDPNYTATIFLAESSPLMPMDLGTLYWRIPAITTTADGKRIVILSDDRTDTNGDLPTHVWVVAQYSDDGGISWSEPVHVAGTAETGGDYGHGDASLITNRITGDIIGIMTSSPNGYGFNNAGSASAVGSNCQAWKTIKSTDGGETWSVPVDHTKELYGPGSPHENWFAGFSGSGAGLQKRDGTLVSPFINKEENTDEDGNVSVSWNYYSFMSKDGGDTWYVSGTSGTTSCDEPKVLERNEGYLAISVRASGYNFHNVTTDDGETWMYAPQTRFADGISGNACNGEYMVWCSTIDGNPFDIVLQTGCNSSSRENVSIALSTDQGDTPSSPKTICPRGSAYSAATVLADGTLGVYYEENGIYTGRGDGFTMRFVRFSLDWASDGKYKFTDEQPYRPVKTRVEFTMPDFEWNTIVLPFDAELPDGWKAFACMDSTLTFTVEDSTQTGILLKQVETKKLLAQTPYVVSGTAGDYVFERPLEDWSAGELAENCSFVDGPLVGHFVQARVLGDGETVYNNILDVPANGGVGFHRVTQDRNAVITPYSCNVQLTKGSEKNLVPLDVDNLPQAIGQVEARQTSLTGRAYDLRGIPRQPGAKGIFVVDGQTILIR